jgi:hypothetical protein
MAAPQIKLDKRLEKFNLHYQLDYRAASICNLMVLRGRTYADWILCRGFIIDLITRPQQFTPPKGRPEFELKVILNFMNGRVDWERGEIIMALVKASLADNGTYNYYEAKALIDLGVQSTEPITVE